MEEKEKLTEEQILQRLLEVDTVPEKTVLVPRFGIPVTLKGLTSKQVDNLREQYTERKTVKGKTIEKLDAEMFNAGLIAAATVSPNWGAQQLLTKYKASGPEEVIRRLFLAGELDALSDIVLDLSGFNIDLEDVKN